MPRELEEMVKKLKSQGKDEQSAYAIATAALQKQGKMKKARKSGRK